MKIDHKLLLDKIHLLSFETQQELASTFLRFQEHYESPYFKDKIFTLEEFTEWYVNNSQKGIETGEFTYCSDWNGFNIPSRILEPFYMGKFDPLSDAEKSFLDIFKNESGSFYIIGVYLQTKNPDALLEHEIAHGLFSTNPEYKEQVLAVLSQFDIEPVKEKLRSKAGYHEDVLDDEVHAYSLDEENGMGIPAELSQGIRGLFEQYYQNI